MTSTPKRCVVQGGQWPKPVDFDCYEELDNKTAQKIRDSAKAPAADDAEWTTVDGPGW